jgi:putative DNA primase/helicase
MNLTVFPTAKVTEGKLYHTSLADVAKLKHHVTGDKLMSNLLFFGELNNNSRKSPIEVKYRNGLILDIDKCSYDCLEDLKKALKGLQYTIYTTFSHDPSKNIFAYRVVIETIGTILPQDYPAVYWNFVNSKPILKRLSDEGILDKRGEDATRSFFAPSCSKERQELVYTYVNGGIPLIPNTQKRAEDILSVVPKGVDEMTKAVANISHKQSSFQKIRESQGCRQIQYIIDNAKELEEPLWYAGLSIAQHCSDRNTAIHDISKDYQGYTPQETEKKANQTQDKPQSCETFNKLNPKVCDGCSHRGKITNPLALGKEEPQVEIKESIFDTYDDLMEAPDMEWLVEDLIVKHSVNMIFGKSGSTKSFLALHMALALSHKREFFDLGSDVDAHVPVIYVALEGKSGMKNRLKGYHQWFSEDKPKDFYISDFNPVLTQDATVDAFIEQTKKLGVKDPLIIIDTYNQATPSMNENDAGQTGAVMKNCQKMVKELGATVLIVHHSNKSEDGDYRGSSAIHGAMDTMLKVKETTGKDSKDSWYQLSVYKIKDGEVGREFSYKTIKVDLGINAKGREQSTLIISEQGLRKQVNQRQKLRDRQIEVNEHLKTWLKAYPDGDLYETVKENIAPKLTVPSNKQNNTFDNIVNKLVNYKYVEITLDGMKRQKIKLL